MAHSLEEFPPLRVLPKSIGAADYNRVRLALLRLGNPLRVSLPHHGGVDIILQRDSWVAVNNYINDLPLLAWREFNVEGRSGLHEPIECRLYFYHIQAGLIMGTALEALSERLEACLTAQRNAASQH